MEKSFKEELAAAYQKNMAVEVNRICSHQMKQIRKACVEAVQKTRASLDFYLEGEAENSMIGRELEKMIEYELGLTAKFHTESDRDCTNYFLRISGWAT